MADSIPTDPIEAMRATRDAMRKMQQVFTKMAMPPAQRQAMIDATAKMMTPGEQLNAMMEFADAFGPPPAQIEEIRSTLAAQREQLDAMQDDLQRMEQMLERLALASETLAAAQAPFRLMMEQWVPGQRSQPTDTSPADSADPDD